MQTIELTLPDGSIRSMPVGTTGADLARSISEGLARNALVLEVDGALVEMNRPLQHSAKVRILTWNDNEGKSAFWHSSAHLLAEALEALYPGIKLGIGPSIEQGFYYDIDFGSYSFSQEDFPKVEAKMLALAKEQSPYEIRPVSKKEAIDHYTAKDDPYKLELIEGLEDGHITFCTQGSFTDLCRGGHIPHTGLIKAVKLLNVAGAYWRGDATRKQLTRIYAISFPKQKELEDFLHLLEEAKRRDHKVLGREMELFMISPAIGGGLPVWLPKGTVVRRKLEEFIKQELLRRGYVEVITPHVGNLNLYRTSGHYPYYADSQFAPIQVEEEEYLLKPMNCPHHHQIYSSKPRSYRDLPLRLAEFGTVYRYEQSGELSGLSRVRGFTQDDAHIYCRHDQLKDELINAIELTQLVFSTFGMPVKTRLSFRDPATPEKYAGSTEMWDQAEREILEVANAIGLDYFVGYGEAAFYGPKFDFIVNDALGRKWQLGTVQVDYVMPERFGLEYAGADNQKHRPVIIHRAPFGSMERFISILIEHFAGHFPVWLAPEQVIVLPISEKFNPYAQEVLAHLQEHGIRAGLDTRDEKIGRKIRDAEVSKTPYMLVIGEKEANSGMVAVRRQGRGDQGTQTLASFTEGLLAEIKALN
jgi:threonyl-tRNA synthetase